MSIVSCCACAMCNCSRVNSPASVLALLCFKTALAITEGWTLDCAHQTAGNAGSTKYSLFDVTNSRTPIMHYSQRQLSSSHHVSSSLGSLLGRPRHLAGSGFGRQQILIVKSSRKKLFSWHASHLPSIAQRTSVPKRCRLSSRLYHHIFI